MRSSAVLFMSLAMALGAVCLAFAAPGRSEPGTMIELENASGAVSIANSRDAQALFSATATRVSQSRSGTLTLPASTFATLPPISVESPFCEIKFTVR